MISEEPLFQVVYYTMYESCTCIAKCLSYPKLVSFLTPTQLSTPFSIKEQWVWYIILCKWCQKRNKQFKVCVAWIHWIQVICIYFTLQRFWAIDTQSYQTNNFSSLWPKPGYKLEKHSSHDAQSKLIRWYEKHTLHYDADYANN